MAMRIPNGKLFEKVTQKTEQGEFEIRIYMVREPNDNHFRAICKDLDVDLRTEDPKADKDDVIEDVDELEAVARKLVKQRADLTWEPYLMVKVEGSEMIRPLRPWEEEPRELLAGRNRDQNRSYMELKIGVKLVDLSEHNGVKRWRYGDAIANDPTNKNKNRNRIFDGWPDVGLDVMSEEEYRSRSRSWYDPTHNRSMRALIKDTPENRAALNAIRDSMEALLVRLETFLSPDHIEQALAAALENAGGLMLPASAEAPEKTTKPKRKRRKPREL